MTQLEKEVKEMEKKLEGLERERIKVEARRDQLMEQLQAKGINSVEAGWEWKRKRDEERERLETEARVLLDEFNEKYKDYL